MDRAEQVLCCEFTLFKCIRVQLGCEIIKCFEKGVVFLKGDPKNRSVFIYVNGVEVISDRKRKVFTDPKTGSPAIAVRIP